MIGKKDPLSHQLNGRNRRHLFKSKLRIAPKHCFGLSAPEWLAPVATIGITGYYFQRSRQFMGESHVASLEKKEYYASKGANQIYNL